MVCSAVKRNLPCPVVRTAFPGQFHCQNVSCIMVRVSALPRQREQRTEVADAAAVLQKCTVRHREMAKQFAVRYREIVPGNLISDLGTPTQPGRARTLRHAGPAPEARPRRL